MNRRGLWTVGGLASLEAAAYAAVIRPWMLMWGSTAEERTRSMPGDDVDSSATYVTTRAVTIRAPAESVWPWLVQMGQDRAGFYTHNWVERVLQSGIPDTSEIRPEWQHLEVGDLMRTNRDIGGTPMGWPVVAIDPGHSLVVSSKSMPTGTYSFAVEPIDTETSRLVARDRARWKWFEWPFAALVYEPLHAYMETGLVSGVRQRAEAAHLSGVGSARIAKGAGRSVGWTDLTARAKAWRLVHASWSVAQLSCLVYIWVSSFRRRRDRKLLAAVAFLLVEGGALVVGRGNCPVGHLQSEWGDPVPFFELLLPPRAAKAATPVLAVVSIGGICAVVWRGGADPRSGRPGPAGQMSHKVGDVPA
jgi:hypothetical protein